MGIIKVNNINKIFRVSHRAEGLMAHISSLFKPSKFEINALRDISFEVKKKEMVALIGPNGAGKSTLLKVLTGVLYPTSGNASVLGITPWVKRKKLAFQIGVMFGQKSNLWYHLPPMDTFRLLADVYEIPPRKANERIDELIELFDIKPFIDIPVRKLSLGQRMRCELASNLLHNPEILFLDEPSIGLDIIVKQKLRQYIKLINDKYNTTVIITSHDVDDVEYLSERVIIINYGQIIWDTSLADLKKKYLKEKYLDLHLHEPVTIPSSKGVELIHNIGTSVKIKINYEVVNINKILSNIIGNGNIIDITITDPPLEEIISNIYINKSAL